MLFNVLGFLLLPFLVKTKLPIKWLGNLYVLIGAIAVIVLAIYSGGIYSALYAWIVSIPLLALLIVGRGSAYFWGILSFAIMVYMGVKSINGYHFPIEYDVSLRDEWMTAIVPGLLLIALFIALVFEYTQKMVLKELALSNDQLLQQKATIENQSEELASLIDEKDYIIRILAHDLRSPLKNINGLVRLLNIEKEKDKREEIIQIIDRTALEAENLVNRVLEMDKSQNDSVELVEDQINMVAFMEQAVSKMQDLANKKQIKIDFLKAGGLSMVQADRTYLNLIFENLISNAIKFSPSKSRIKVMVTSNVDRVKVTVMDQGPGIEENEVPLLFKKFSKLSPRPTAGESSTGLGLALVKRYTDLIDGEVYYDHKAKNEGATFVVKLPLI